MTRYEKSDAQLDAEVGRKIIEGAEYTPPEYGSESGYTATPSAPPALAPASEGLMALVDHHRALLAADLLIPKLVSRQPPTSLDVNTGVLHQEPGSAIGMSMSGRLLRYLSHPEGYGSDFAWSKALHGLRWHCRRWHPHHRSADRPYWRGALCHQAVMLVVVRRFSPANAAKILRLDHIEPLLTSAFREIETQIDDARARAEKRERTLEAHVRPVNTPPPVRERHDIPGEHQRDCPACVGVAS